MFISHTINLHARFLLFLQKLSSLPFCNSLSTPWTCHRAINFTFQPFRHHFSFATTRFLMFSHRHHIWLCVSPTCLRKRQTKVISFHSTPRNLSHSNGSRRFPQAKSSKPSYPKQPSRTILPTATGFYLA